MASNLASQKLIFWGPSWPPFWGGLGGSWAPQTTFFGPHVGPLSGPPKFANYCCKEGTQATRVHFWPIFNSFQLQGVGIGAPTWGPKKVPYGAPGSPRPSQNGGQLGPQKIQFLRSKLAPILGGSWRPRSIFWGPTWLHVGLMLAVNMSPCWTANMDLCWRPTWTYVGGQHGPMLEANMDPCSVCPGSNSVCPGSNSVCPGAVLCARGAVLCARGAILCAWEQFCVPRQQKINIFYPRTIKNQYFLSPDHDKSYFLFRDHWKSIFSVPGPLKINIFYSGPIKINIFNPGITKNQYSLSPDT